MLNLSNNTFRGTLPSSLSSLNLSWNALTGTIPPQISALNKLSILDLSHNELEGDLMALAGLENLISLNISHNNFTGYLPDNKLFQQLSETEMAGNQGLCSKGRDSCFLRKATSMSMSNNSKLKRSHRIKLVIALLITLTIAMAIFGAIAVFRARKLMRDDCESEMGGDSWPWHFTPFQKLNFSVEQVLKCLVEANVIGKGCS
ncbi:hypothetical protein MANES_04G052244v8 [Manihot esculenta]|uniref:Uncharacterized protein n=1 Tax=Manihot esculenta TaxID=3983 RepID=A0ACB7HSB5_MANES|nr:hypothetical protein MANES_04G052244v8 [Manihot esculenta]